MKPFRALNSTPLTTIHHGWASACLVFRMLEQVPTQMCEGAVRWAKLVIPLVVHSASKVRLRAAAALEMGMPLLLAKQTEVAAIIEPMMSTVSFCVSALCCIE